MGTQAVQVPWRIKAPAVMGRTVSAGKIVQIDAVAGPQRPDLAALD